MLTREDKDEIKQLVMEIVAEFPPVIPPVSDEGEESALILALRKNIIDSQVRETVAMALAGTESIKDVTTRAIKVFGTEERALRWLRSPVRSLGNKTPISLLNAPEGVAAVQEVLGQVEHGVW